MAKSKKNRKKDATRAGIASGLAAGAATFVAGQAAKTVIKEIVEAGTDRFFPVRSRGKGAQADAGLLTLQVLERQSPREGPVTVADLVRALNASLLDVADTLRGLRRLRLVKFVNKHRAVRLTGQGREMLERLRRPAGATNSDEHPAPPGPGAEAGNGVDPNRDAEATASSDDGSAVSAPPAAEEA